MTFFSWKYFPGCTRVKQQNYLVRKIQDALNSEVQELSEKWKASQFGNGNFGNCVEGMENLGKKSPLLSGCCLIPNMWSFLKHGNKVKQPKNVLEPPALHLVSQQCVLQVLSHGTASACCFEASRTSLSMHCLNRTTKKFTPGLVVPHAVTPKYPGATCTPPMESKLQ